MKYTVTIQIRSFFPKQTKNLPTVHRLNMMARKGMHLGIGMTVTKHNINGYPLAAHMFVPMILSRKLARTVRHHRNLHCRPGTTMKVRYEQSQGKGIILAIYSLNGQKVDLEVPKTSEAAKRKEMEKEYHERKRKEAKAKNKNKIEQQKKRKKNDSPQAQRAALKRMKKAQAALGHKKATAKPKGQKRSKQSAHKKTTAEGKASRKPSAKSKARKTKSSHISQSASSSASKKPSEAKSGSASRAKATTKTKTGHKKATILLDKVSHGNPEDEAKSEAAQAIQKAKQKAEKSGSESSAKSTANSSTSSSQSSMSQESAKSAQSSASSVKSSVSVTSQSAPASSSVSSSSVESSSVQSESSSSAQSSSVSSSSNSVSASKSQAPTAPGSEQPQNILSNPHLGERTANYHRNMVNQTVDKMVKYPALIKHTAKGRLPNKAANTYRQLRAQPPYDLATATTKLQTAFHEENWHGFFQNLQAYARREFDKTIHTPLSAQSIQYALRGNHIPNDLDALAKTKDRPKKTKPQDKKSVF